MTADRHLLLGLLALQNGIINQGQLVAAFQTWTLDKTRSLADHLEARGDLTTAKRALLEALAQVHLEAHGGDVEKSLAVVSAGRSTQESLARIGDPDVQATLARVESGSTDNDEDRTGTYSVGAATSGQRFRILRPHAQGGLGAVFVALDSELHREVALKQILDQHADDPTSRTRFVLEAEITGRLEHPGIVPVYGLGSFGSGRPYYAMRFIRGESLKDAIATFHADPTTNNGAGLRSLAMRKLLRRFVDVCNAIEYAHTRGVIHRDIKPANVIVGKHGETLVVDWGLAKATGSADPTAGEQTLVPTYASGSAETLPGSALGTPAYMSPEQAAGELDHVGPWSDLYSLGGTLYCLLTGKPPFEGNDLGAILRKVQKGEISPPRSLNPTIDRALEAVCLKAMALRPEDRYGSCKALADDVERWMADEPVSAYREPLVVRARRRMRRHRTLVTSVVAALIAAVIGMSALIVVQARANQAERRSKALVAAQFDLALNAVKTYYQGVAGDALLSEPAMGSLRQTLLESPRMFFQELKTKLETSGEHDPKTREKLAGACTDLGQITDKIGRPEDAVRAYQQAIAILEPMAREQPREARFRVELADNLIHLGTSERTRGRTDLAEDAYRTALTVLDRDRDGRPDNGRARFLLANAYTSLALLDQSKGRLERAETAHLAALAIRVDLDEREPDIDQYREGWAWNHNGLGLLYRAVGKPALAIEQYGAALKILDHLVRKNPKVIRYRLPLAHHHNNVAIAQTDLGRIDDAIQSYRQAIKVHLDLCHDQPAVAKFRGDMGMAYTNLGGLFNGLRRYDEAEPELRLALEVLEALAREYPDVGEYQDDLASTHNNLGLLYERTGRMERAESEQTAAVKIRKDLVRRFPDVSPYRIQLAGSLANLADLARTREAYARSLGIYAEAIESLRDVLRLAPNDANAHAYLTNAYWSRAEALDHLDRHVEALADWDRAIEQAENDRSRAELMPRRSLTKIQLGQVDQAIADAEVLLRPDRSPSGDILYNVACVFTQAAEAIAGATRIEASERTRRAAALAGQAVSLLRQLSSQGYFEIAANRSNLPADPDLASLKSRADFQELLLDVAFPADPFSR